MIEVTAMDESELVGILKGSSDFATVSDRAIGEFVRAGVVREPAVGSEITRQGEASPQVWVLLSGELEVIADGEVVNRITTPGEVVGQISAVSFVPATATVRVAAESRCLSISQQSLHQIIATHPDLAAALLRSMAKYLGAR